MSLRGRFSLLFYCCFSSSVFLPANHKPQTSSFSRFFVYRLLSDVDVLLIASGSCCYHFKQQKTTSGTTPQHHTTPTMSRMFVSVFCGLALVASSIGAEVNCPVGWEKLMSDGSASCLGVFVTKSTWYEAEALCRSHDAHLVHVDTAAKAGLLKKTTDSPLWIGAFDDEDGWQWISGGAVDKPALDTLLGARMYTPRTCATHEATSLCTARHHFVCEKVLCGADIRTKTLSFRSFGVQVAVTPKAVLQIDKTDSANGVWETASRFVVTQKRASSVFSCDSFAAEFSVSRDGSMTVQTGCADAKSLGIAATPVTVHCTVEAGEPSGEGLLQPNKPTAPPSGTSAPKLGAVDDDDDSVVPMWVWPIAFVTVAVASALAGIAGANRKRAFYKPRPETNSQEADSSEMGEFGEGVCDDESPPTAENPSKCPRHKRTTATCDTCQKFNAAVAKRRLKAVHEQLARDFLLPLVVHNSKCEHIEGDHVHIFTVENDFDASTLGALSTVYSRAKPRLPRSTRIHIVRGNADGTAIEEDPFTSGFPQDGAYY